MAQEQKSLWKGPLKRCLDFKAWAAHAHPKITQVPPPLLPPLLNVLQLDCKT